MKPFLCFVHIERAGGTTLHHLLRNSFPTFLTLHPWHYWTNEPENACTPSELSALVRTLPFTRGVGGHTTRPYLDYAGALGRDVFTFTFLREPISRFMSHLNYQRLRMGVAWSVDAFLAEPRFANFQTTRLAGSPSLSTAKRVLDERIDYVGLTERFDESLLLLQHVLQDPALDVHYERKNALREGEHPLDFDELTGPQQARIRQINALDIALHRFAVDEIVPRFRDAYRGDLAADTERLRDENADFVYPRWRRRLSRVYRGATSVLIEPGAHRFAQGGYQTLGSSSE